VAWGRRGAQVRPDFHYDKAGASAAIDAPRLSTKKPRIRPGLSGFLNAGRKSVACDEWATPTIVHAQFDFIDLLTNR